MMTSPCHVTLLRMTVSPYTVTGCLVLGGVVENTFGILAHRYIFRYLPAIFLHKCNFHLKGYIFASYICVCHMFQIFRFLHNNAVNLITITVCLCFTQHHFYQVYTVDNRHGSHILSSHVHEEKIHTHMTSLPCHATHYRIITFNFRYTLINDYYVYYFAFFTDIY